MGLFGRGKKDASKDDAPLRSASDVTDRVRICEESVATVRARRDATVTALEVVEAKFGAANAAFDLAVEAYQDEPGDRTAKTVREAREAREFAELELVRPRKARADADQDLEVAEAALEDARAEVARIENERRIEVARKAASPERFHAVTRPIWERFIVARKAANDALDAIVDEFEKAHSIGEALTAEGVECVRVTSYQSVAQYCLIHAEQDPSLVLGFIRELRLGENRPTLDGFGSNRRAALRHSLKRLVLDSDHLDQVGRSARHETPVPIEKLREFFQDTMEQFETRERERLERERLEREAMLTESQQNEAAKRTAARRRSAVEGADPVRRMKASGDVAEG